MPVTVIVGGQFGSEGKGKVAHFFARETNAHIVVRVGGSNSGHTVIDDQGRQHVFRHLPTAAVLPDTICVLGPGTYIDPEVLRAEVERVNLPKERLVIDQNAFVITAEHKRREKELRLGERIGSTLSGTGEAVVDRVRRQSADNLASNHPYLSKFTHGGSARKLLRKRLDQGQDVVIEGTQGFGLSNLQSPYYPKATSRDTTAAAFVAEAGISPRDVDSIVLVLRAFPIRVAGKSGELPNETNWTEVAREGGWPEGLEERTSVTQNVRRVARFDADIVHQAIEANAPTHLVLNHLDYFDAQVRETNFTPRLVESLSDIEGLLCRRVDLIGTSPKTLCWRDNPLLLRQERRLRECA